MNPMLSFLMQAMFGKNDILNMFNQVRTAKDPNVMIQTLMQTNPQMKETMDVIGKYPDAKQAFYAMAQQKNQDPNTIINELKKYMQ